MAVALIELCDLCLGDGKRVLAVAVYWNSEDEEWHACSKHLKDVRAVGLRYELLKEDED